MSHLTFQKAKDAEVAWINAQIVNKETLADAKRLNVDNEPMEGNDFFCPQDFMYILNFTCS